MSEPEPTIRAKLSAVAKHLNLLHETRVRELRVHGYKAFALGVLVLALGGNHAIEVALGSWMRLALGGVAVVAGLVLLWETRDLSEDVSRLRAQLFAVRLLIGWDLFMALGLAITLASYSGWDLTVPWESAPLGQPAAFPLAIYLSLAAMLGLHSRAISRVLARAS